MQQPFATLAEAAAALRSGAVGSRELVAAALADADTLDPLLGVYVTRFPEQALAAARAADSRPAAERGPLHGLPLAVKDNLATVEGPATAQSPAHDPHWWCGRDAPAVARLRRAGAVVLGKTTMAEYAMGRPDPAHPFPVPRNPWDPERWTGGSSTGNGAGIASGLFLGALGSDTSGSVRLPAALCGTTGLKTSFGLLPTDGCLPLSPSQDVLGPMAVSAGDCGLLLDALTGQPGRAPGPSDIQGLRVGVPYGLLAAAGGLIPAHLYLRAQRTRERLTAALLERLDGPAGADVIATPTWPAPARPYARETAPGDELNLTAVWNPTGFPALALPMGADPAGLPLSLQLAGRPRGEHTLLRAGEAFQSVTTWHLRRAAPDPRHRPAPLRDPDREEPAPAPSLPGPGHAPAGVEEALAAVGIKPGPADLAVVGAVARGILAAPRRPAA
ncbi:amidase [Streptomyces sp. ITFR-6]|uniref:amidase n=1 Tax=Streptomyces sp. ITFR-6 TaxID=3075197 RepID=UPI00288A4ECE|nr:amidase [Streptomyces sp. ITFR-6]WNI33449.1 amidase [Streptomyces sp. ITFR-6]